ncbi:MAG: serine hydrolase domain-containing protein [Litorimonas sp.]
MAIQGHYDPAFKAVRDLFEENFLKRGEVGASVCLQDRSGRALVDLWGGTHADGETPWTRDTMSIVFSCTKAATALCAQVLIDRGELDPSALVTKYWPEFGARGKDSTTVRDMLGHRSGVPALRTPVKPGGFLDFKYVTNHLAKETPFWDPGTTHGYHMVTFGWTVGELVRRVSGRSLGEFFKKEIAKPYGVDFHIGLPDSEFARVSKLLVYKPGPQDTPSAFVKAMFADPAGIQALAFGNNGGWFFDAPESWRAEIGGAGGVSNARGLAAMFGTIFSEKPLLSKSRIGKLREPVSEGMDTTLCIPTRFGEGFMLSIDNRDLPGEGQSAILGSGAFGHVGMGGSIGFADPESEFSFGYTMNKMGGGILLNERGQSLIDAAYECL